MEDITHSSTDRNKPNPNKMSVKPSPIVVLLLSMAVSFTSASFSSIADQRDILPVTGNIRQPDRYSQMAVKLTDEPKEQWMTTFHDDEHADLPLKSMRQLCPGDSKILRDSLKSTRMAWMSWDDSRKELAADRRILRASTKAMNQATKGVKIAQAVFDRSKEGVVAARKAVSGANFKVKSNVKKLNSVTVVLNRAREKQEETAKLITKAEVDVAEASRAVDSAKDINGLLESAANDILTRAEKRLANAQKSAEQADKSVLRLDRTRSRLNRIAALLQRNLTNKKSFLKRKGVEHSRARKAREQQTKDLADVSLEKEEAKSAVEAARTITEKNEEVYNEAKKSYDNIKLTACATPTPSSGPGRP